MDRLYTFWSWPGSASIDQYDFRVKQYGLARDPRLREECESGAELFQYSVVQYDSQRWRLRSALLDQEFIGL
ncbi:MAG: hypothetical protein ACJAYU_000800 [Bradymonadia bacterium]|jgi:hypothetical protein